MRRSGFCVLGVYLILASGQSPAGAVDDAELPLPQWTRQELDAMRASPQRPPLLGDLLGSADDLEEVATDRPLLLGQGEDNIGDSPEKTQPSADLSRFLLPSLLKSIRSHPSSLSSTSPLKSLTEVSAAFLHECEQAPATTRLLDPNHELSETAVEEFERFLAFHAGDSHIPLTLVILNRSQKLPDKASLARFASGSVARGSSALVVCPYGDPKRTRFFVSQPIRNAVPADYLNSLLENCIHDSLRATDPDEQLHRLLVQISIRLFWVQRMLPSEPETVMRGIVPVPEAPVTTLNEVLQPSGHGFRWSWSWFGPALALALLALYALWRWHRFQMRHYQWLLPAGSEPAAPRFGGASCGGGVSIRYR